MRKYKIDIKKTYCIDVLAENEDQAKEKAEIYLFNSLQEGQGHYLETGGNEVIFYDVTNTDDPFSVSEEDIQKAIIKSSNAWSK